MKSLPKLKVVRPGVRADGRFRVIVFVHGIYSSHATFCTMLPGFEGDKEFDQHELVWYDYDWGQPIRESAAQLRSILLARYPVDVEITIVGHSMGGLVGRFVIIDGSIPTVKRLVMIASPNYGAIMASRTSTLWQWAIAGAGTITPMFPRKRGLRDLTRVQTLYDQIGREGVQGQRALEVEYVTIPGLFYHDDRRDSDPGLDGGALLFTIIGLGLRALALVEPAEVRIERPHDGIVEESSVHLQGGTARFCEKDLCFHDSRLPRTYAHVTPQSSLDLVHVRVHHDKAVCDAVRGILSENSVVDWRASLTRPHALRISIP